MWRLCFPERKGALSNDSAWVLLGFRRWLGQRLRAAIRVHVSSADVRMVMREAEKTIIPFPVERPKESPRELLELQPNAKACIRKKPHSSTTRAFARRFFVEE